MFTSGTKQEHWLYTQYWKKCKQRYYYVSVHNLKRRYTNTAQLFLLRVTSNCRVNINVSQSSPACTAWCTIKGVACEQYKKLAKNLVLLEAEGKARVCYCWPRKPLPLSQTLHAIVSWAGFFTSVPWPLYNYITSMVITQSTPTMSI